MMANNDINNEQNKVNLDDIRIAIYVVGVLLAFAIGLIQLFLNRKHHKNTYDMNVLNNTLSITRQVIMGDIKKTYDEIKIDLNKINCTDWLWDDKKSIKDVLELNINPEDKIGDEFKKDIIYRIKLNTYTLLNFYDCMATSIENELIDSSMIFNHFSLMVIDIYRWSKPLIDEQNSNDAICPWLPFTSMAKAYIQNQDLLRDELSNHRNNIFMKKVKKIK